MKRTLLILILSIFLTSCEKFDLFNNHSDGYPKDANYPTIINELATDSLNRLKALFFDKNIYIESPLNRYGFCGGDGMRTTQIPPIANPLTKSEVIEIVRNFVARNSQFTGVEKPENLTFLDVKQALYNPYCWSAVASAQMIDTTEVLFTNIVFHIIQNEVYLCYGNWYPNIYIPSTFNIDQTKAKKSLINHKATFFTWGGSYNQILKSGDLEKSTVKLYVYPKQTDTRTELRVTWKIDIPDPVFYVIYIDVMTGEIVFEGQTFIMK